MDTHSLVTSDAWQQLRRVTPARIALGRAGSSLPTREWLAFRSAHAAARDAVHESFDAAKLAAEVASLGVETIVLGTCAADRLTFLQRPDLGRRFDEESAQRLKALPRQSAVADLAIIVSDGLSALAANRQSVPLLSQLLPRLRSDHWKLAPIAVVRFGRVALEDQAGQLVGAQVALMLLGERPGLGSPDSLGAYLVYSPGPRNTDANRNCVSNIRPEGLAWSAAADTIFYLLTEARRRRLSGVQLKDERVSDLSKTLAQRDNTSRAASEK
jgi:ethanolamine ammonia-lyase small subunit